MQMGSTPLGKYEYITDQGSIPLIIIDAKKEKYLGIDTENSGGLDVLVPNVKLLLFQIEIAGRAFVIDARKVDLSPFKEILEDSRYVKIIQNSVYDYKILSVLRNIYIRGIYDTKLGEHLLNAGVSKGETSLEDLAFRYLDYRLDKTVTATFFDFPYDGEFTNMQLAYAAEDVLVLPEIRKRQQMYLNQLHLNRISDLEFSLAPTVGKMELFGVKLDADRWRITLDKLNKKLFKVSNDIRQVLPDPPPPPPKPIRLKKDGTPFANTAKQKPPPVLNLNSWQQIVEACSKVGISFEAAHKKTGKGLTDNSTLRLAAEMYKNEPEKSNVIKDIIKYRELGQIKKTFGENLIDHIRSDGRIHGRFNQDGTDSGRFSSSEPNLQNIQKKGTEGKILRSCFIPEVGNKFIIADYSQIELRIVAELSGDEKMIEILNDPRGDIHKATASEMFNIDYDKVTKDLRGTAKTINFGINYGMSGNTLSDRLECSLIEAIKHLISYGQTYPTLMWWLDEEGKKALDNGYSKTIGGRIRWFPSLDPNADDYKRKRGFFERVGRNHPIQGCSADMTKTSMVILDEVLEQYGAKMVNTIHDELCIEVPSEYAIEVAKLVKRKMIFAGQKFLKKVPVLVDVKIRDCWFKDDGVDDDENGQQLWLMPLDFGENGKE